MTRKIAAVVTVCALAGVAAAGPSAGHRGEPGHGPAAPGLVAATTPQAASPAAFKAVAELSPTAGHRVSGTVTFDEMPSGVVRVSGTITGLAPGSHGFHVHASGDCSAADASSAGPHYSVEDHPHGAPENPASQRHTGDLGNILADAAGVAVVDILDSLIDLTGPHSIVGRAVIVHQDADDLKSQPSGAAGARVACGRIVAAAVS